MFTYAWPRCSFLAAYLHIYVKDRIALDGRGERVRQSAGIGHRRFSHWYFKRVYKLSLLFSLLVL